ncbi:MAG TPA: hypothetical protein VE269_06945, partial [Gaiellaceae bacterium]|nr:hypothetical protein [Gaiellaceae bacterium]
EIARCITFYGPTTDMWTPAADAADGWGLTVTVTVSSMVSASVGMVSGPPLANETPAESTTESFKLPPSQPGSAMPLTVTDVMFPPEVV